MKCGALEPLSRALLCRGGDDNGKDGRVEVQRVVERDGKLHLEVAHEEAPTGNAAPAEEQTSSASDASAGLEVKGNDKNFGAGLEVDDNSRNGRGQMMFSENLGTFEDGGEEMDADSNMLGASRTFDDTYADAFDEACNLYDEVEAVMLGARTFTYQHNHGCGQMMCADDDYEYGTFDEGEETDAAADMLAKDMMLGASRTYTFDDTSIEDQKSNLDDVDDRSAYISGASTYDDESTILNKRSQKTVNPVQNFIYNVFGVEDPPPVEKQKLSSVLEEHSVGTSTRTGSAAEDVIKSPSSLPSARLRRADKGSIRGMELAFISEAGPESEEIEKEKEKSVAVDNDDDDGTVDTALNVTQDSSADSEKGSDGGVEDETAVLSEELALESSHDDDDKVSTTRSTGNEEDNNSVKLGVQGGTKEKPDEHSDASASLVLTHKIVIDEATIEEPTREDDEGKKADVPTKSVDGADAADAADAADDKEEKADVPTKSTDMIVSQEQQQKEQKEQKEQSKAPVAVAVTKSKSKSKKAGGASGKRPSKWKKIFAKSIRSSKKSVATF